MSQARFGLERLGIGAKTRCPSSPPNVPEMLECHFGVLMAKAVLNALNVRLDPPLIAFILEHSEAKCLIVDRSLAETARRALEQLDRDLPVVTIDDPAVHDGPILGTVYEDFIAGGDPDYPWWLPDDEWQACCLNYTSGTTGNPKGVVYSHRGAYLNAIGNIVTWDLPQRMVYLWTLPMFHCNGWCFPWTVTAKAGTHVCLRQVQAKAIYDALADNDVTHFCGAPIIMGLLVNAPADERRELSRRVKMMTAGAAPPAAVLEATEAAGFDVTHVYGLTEVYGPAAVCDWHLEWDHLPAQERSDRKARQGVRYVLQEDMIVADPPNPGAHPRATVKPSARSCSEATSRCAATSRIHRPPAKHSTAVGFTPAT